MNAFQLHDQRHTAFLAGKKLPVQYVKPFKELQLFEERLTDPLSWRKPRLYAFCRSEVAKAAQQYKSEHGIK